eukprot:758388-Hanusia_phi.AAC.11
MRRRGFCLSLTRLILRNWSHAKSGAVKGRLLHCPSPPSPLPWCWIRTRDLAAAHGTTMSRWASTREAKDTSMEAKLRQLYLQVHPDLFSSFPAARKENEKSFQVLSEFLEIMKGGSPVRTKTFALKFYIKPGFYAR